MTGPQIPSPVPGVSQVTLRVYLSLPQMFRDADAQQTAAGGYPLLRYLSLVGDQLNAVQTLYDRFNYVGPTEHDPWGNTTSELVDPTVADLAWLPWLAQLLGGDVDTTTSAQSQRDSVTSAANGWQAGTKKAIAAAAQSALTGSRYVLVLDHMTPSGTGGTWDVLIRTRASETPNVYAVLEAITEKGAKPAGVRLSHDVYSSTWAVMGATYPTWAAMGAVTFRQLEEAGAPGGSQV